MSKPTSYEIDFIHANGEARSVVQFAHSEREAIQNLEARKSRYIKRVTGAHLFVPDEVIEEQAEDYLCECENFTICDIFGHRENQ